MNKKSETPMIRKDLFITDPLFSLIDKKLLFKHDLILTE